MNRPTRPSRRFPRGAWRAIIAGLVIGLGLLRASSADQPSAETAAEVAVSEVGPIGITVADLRRSVEFYTEVLGFSEVGRQERSGEAFERSIGVFGARTLTARLRLGGETIELTEFLVPEGRPVPLDSRSNDLWFQHIAIVVRDIDRAYSVLREHGVRHASSAPQTLPSWNRIAGGIGASYFKDPDGHALEIIHFPAGKGDARWQQPGDGLFQGIDHTAIVVADTERSLAFYRGRLGLRVAGASENFGTEQEYLNGVFASRLRITSLRADRGPGIELLEYIAPSDGREYPRDARACDLVHWQTALVVRNAEAGAAAVRSAFGRWISPGAVSDPLVVSSRRALVRDPDGHALLLQEEAPTGASHSESHP